MMASIQAIRRVRSLYRSDETAKRFFDWIENTHHQGKASLHDDLPVTDVDEIQEGRNAFTKLQRAEAVSLFKTLQKERFGNFKAGRREAASRFVWDYEPMSVMRCAKQLSGDLVEAEMPDVDDERETEEPEGDELAQPPRVVHRYRLRDGVEVSVSLPSDLTEREAERFAAFIRTLPE